MENLLNQIDNLVWGVPLLVFACRNRNIPDYKTKTITNLKITISFKVCI